MTTDIQKTTFVPPQTEEEGKYGVFSRTGWKPPKNMDFQQWAEIGPMIGAMSDSLNYAMGDWANAGERKWGEMYSQVIDETGWRYDKITKAAWVTRNVPPEARQHALYWSHAVAVAHLPVNEQIKWLKRASEEHWNTQQLRQLCRLEGVDPGKATLKLLEETEDSDNSAGDDMDRKDLINILKNNPDVTLDGNLSDLGLNLGPNHKGKSSTILDVSDLEAQFLVNYQNLGGTHMPIPQHQFAEDRNWRFDYAWPPAMVAVEIQGGQYVQRYSKDGEFKGVGGGHHTPSGYRDDVQKLNAATVLGWRVFILTSDMVEDSRVIVEIMQVVDAAWGTWTKLRELGIYSTEDALNRLLAQMETENGL